MIDHAAIARLVPHAGSMCLLDRVLEWTPQHIRCAAETHRSAHNPMRHAGRLGVVCGVEYASQAMALHGALCQHSLAQGGVAQGGVTQGGVAKGGVMTPEIGFLASVRALTCHVGRLDDLPGALEVAAERLHGEGGRVMYGFVLRHDGQVLLEGRAAVVIGGPAVGVIGGPAVGVIGGPAVVAATGPAVVAATGPAVVAATGPAVVAATGPAVGGDRRGGPVTGAHPADEGMA